MANYDRTLSSGVDVTNGDLDLRLIANYRALNNALISDDIVTVLDAIQKFNNVLLQSGVAVSDSLLKSIQAGEVISRVLASNVSASDGQLEKYSLSNIIASNNVSPHDLLTVTLELFGAFERILSDSVDTNDAMGIVVSELGIFSRRLVSTLGVTDLSALTRLTSLFILESISTYDSLSQTRNLTKAYKDNISILDYIGIVSTSALVLSRVISSGVDLNDVVARYAIIDRVVSDSSEVKSAIISSALANRNLHSDYISVLDAIVSDDNVVIIRALVSGLSITDDALAEVLRVIFEKIIYKLESLNIDVDVE